MSTTQPPLVPADIAELRKDYSLKSLEEKDADRDPMKQFGVWMVEFHKI